jgi:MoxR-like ATPase
LNEREFHQGTDIIPMNLTTVFCASNEVPSDPRLMPLYDRLLLRRHLQPIRDGSSFITMLDLVREEKPDPLLVWDEVRLAQAQAATIAIPLPVREAVAQIREALAEVDIRPSDRRCYDAQRVVRAAAWLDGCTVAEAEHLRCLSDIFWSHPDQIHDVEHIVDTILEPLISQADELLRGVRALNQQIRSDVEETERQRLANELHDKAKDAARQLAELAAASSGSPRQRRKLEAVDAALRDLSHRILVELFQIDVGP